MGHNSNEVFRLADAARTGVLLRVRCDGCRRTVYYLASDLVELLRPERPAHEPPFACSRCRTADYILVKIHTPDSGDYGHLEVRRPGPVVKTQTWRTVKLGDA
jgi:hypothetical protein